MEFAKEAWGKLVAWVVMSSANPQQVSLTIKGLAVTAVPAILTFMGFVHIGTGIDVYSLTSLFTSLANVVAALLTAVGLIMAFYGAARKVYNEIVTPSGSSTYTHV